MESPSTGFRSLPAVITLAVALAASLASACSVVRNTRNIQELKAGSSTTIHGTLVKSELESPDSWALRLLYFKVQRAFGIEAAPGDTLIVATTNNPAACGVNYAIGSEVVVFASKPGADHNPSDYLWTVSGSYNISSPTESQLDSLDLPASMRNGRFLEKDPAKAGSGKISGAVQGKMTFSRTMDQPAKRREADGRLSRP